MLFPPRRDGIPGTGFRARLISYLTTDPASEKYVLGCVPYFAGSRQEGYFLALRRLSQANNNSTTFFFDWENNLSGFRLRWGSDQSKFATWTGHDSPLYLNSDPQFLTKDSSLFTTDSVKDGRWSALNTSNHSYVLDVKGGTTADNTPVLQWKWNGGDNQVWRAEMVEP